MCVWVMCNQFSPKCTNYFYWCPDMMNLIRLIVMNHNSYRNNFFVCQKVRKWVNKIRFKHFGLLLLCVCVHNWSVSQWKQYEFQIWSSWRIYLFFKWKAPRNSTPENGHVRSRWVLSMLSFTYMTNQNITSVTDLHRGDIALHSSYKIDYH